MKTIHRKDFIEVGSVVKVHGTRGEMKFALSREVNLKEWAFLEFRGKPVPFYIESVKAEFNDEVILKLQGIENVESASLLIKQVLLLPKKSVKKLVDWDEFPIQGYLVTDQESGVLGVVEEILEYPYQTLARINYTGRELLIPLVDEIILEINEKKKTMLVNLPKGLLDI